MGIFGLTYRQWLLGQVAVGAVAASRMIRSNEAFAERCVRLTDALIAAEANS